MCENMEKCAFLVSVEGCSRTLETVQRMLCKSDHKNCARFIVHELLGFEQVPDALLPTDHISAEKLIQEARAVPA